MDLQSAVQLVKEYPAVLVFGSAILIYLFFKLRSRAKHQPGLARRSVRKATLGSGTDEERGGAVLHMMCSCGLISYANHDDMLFAGSQFVKDINRERWLEQQQVCPGCPWQAGVGSFVVVIVAWHDHVTPRIIQDRVHQEPWWPLLQRGPLKTKRAAETGQALRALPASSLRQACFCRQSMKRRPGASR